MGGDNQGFGLASVEGHEPTLGPALGRQSLASVHLPSAERSARNQRQPVRDAHSGFRDPSAPRAGRAHHFQRRALADNQVRLAGFRVPSGLTKASIALPECLTDAGLHPRLARPARQVA